MPRPATSPPARPPRGPRALLRRHAGVVRGWLIFFGTLAGFTLLLQWGDPALFHRAQTVTAHATATALRLLGTDARVDGFIVATPGFTFRVIGECTALHVIATFIAAVAAYPASWRARLRGLALGVPAIAAMNLVRMVTLCYVGAWRPEWLEVAHRLVWQSLLTFLVVLLWIAWVSLIARAAPLRPAAGA